ncbi:hypothetical protein CI102_2196 [Trichoderma harzianum]|nr:hypothetical protein CI102_2196 [Trichoderma harzianum]
MFCWQSSSRVVSNHLPSIHTTDGSCRCRDLLRQSLLLLLQFPTLTPIIVITILEIPTDHGRPTDDRRPTLQRSLHLRRDLHRSRPILHRPKSCPTRPRSNAPILCSTRRRRESHAASHAITWTAQTRHAPDGGDGHKVHRAGSDTQPSLLVLDYCSSTVPPK